MDRIAAKFALRPSFGSKQSHSGRGHQTRCTTFAGELSDAAIKKVCDELGIVSSVGKLQLVGQAYVSGESQTVKEKRIKCIARLVRALCLKYDSLYLPTRFSSSVHACILSATTLYPMCYNFVSQLRTHLIMDAALTLAQEAAAKALQWAIAEARAVELTDNEKLFISTGVIFVKLAIFKTVLFSDRKRSVQPERA
jgi:hypothetical protein